MNAYRKITYTVITFIFFLTPIEIALRILNHKYHFTQTKIIHTSIQNTDFPLFEYDPNTGWKNKPNAQGIFKIPDRESFVKINSFGFRGENLSPQKTHKKRIMFFGDSFTWGYGVSNSETFIEKLSSLFPKDSLELINCGVPGYGTDQEYLYFKKIGSLWKPDIVILLLFDYDIAVDNIRGNHENGYLKPYFDFDDHGSLILKNHPVKKFIPKDEKKVTPSVQLKYTYLPLTYQILSKRLRFLKYDILKTNKTLWNFSLKLKSKKDLHKGFFITREILKLFKAEADTLGATLIVVAGHEQSHLQKNPSINLIALKDFFQKNNILYIDPYESLYRENKKNPLYIQHDSHWNAHGHEIMAHILYQKLQL